MTLADIYNDLLVVYNTSRYNILFGCFVWLPEIQWTFSGCRRDLRVMSQGTSTCSDMQLWWRKGNNQRPVASLITISGYRIIQHPSLEVLILAVIQILADYGIAEPLIWARTGAPSTPPAESDDDERLHNSKLVKQPLLLFW